MLSILLATALAAASQACAPLAGAEALFARPQTHIVWVGETHGSAESPGMVFDLICAAGKTGRPVVVALEREQDEQAAWDAFLRADEPAMARAALLRASSWAAETQDGRSSRAMLALADHLRLAYRAGVIADVRLIIPPIPGAPDQPFDPQAYEARMAMAVADLAKAHPDALVLAYSGNAHNRRGQNTAVSPAYTFAAGLLPAETLVTVRIVGQSGQSWTCQQDGCGVHAYPSEDKGPRRVESTGAGGLYDFTAYIGRPMTASPPAKAP